MENKHCLYRCIVLIFVIYTGIQMLLVLISLIVANFNLNIYIELFAELLLYLALIYWVFFRMKKIPEVSLSFFAGTVIFFFLPKDIFYNYSIEQLRELSYISDFEKALKVLFQFIFALFSAIKLYSMKHE